MLGLVYSRTPTSCHLYEGHLGQETDPTVKIMMQLPRKIIFISGELFLLNKGCQFVVLVRKFDDNEEVSGSNNISNVIDCV